MKAKASWKSMMKYGAKIKALIWSTNNNSDDYDEKHMKVKLSSGDGLTLKKGLELYEKKIFFRSVLNGGNKYYPQVFLNDCLYKLAG